MHDNETPGLIFSDAEEPSAEQQDAWEQRFFFIYHLHMQPSEYERLTDVERDWLMQRYIAQKNMERDVMEQMRKQRAGGLLIPEATMEYTR